VEKKSFEKIKREINAELHENIELNEIFSKIRCISSMIDVNLENEIFLSVVTLRCTKVPFAKAPGARRAGWNLIRVLACVNTQSVHSLALNS